MDIRTFKSVVDIVHTFMKTLSEDFDRHSDLLIKGYPLGQGRGKKIRLGREDGERGGGGGGGDVLNEKNGGSGGSDGGGDELNVENEGNGGVGS
ncbi:hypothetical protein SO802_010859 [Lithocarpus litseifolius]|uniref:Uncharacterized protein n=1 Tax=Lithocarpus litseifolius TaxID=425828 RepID=A0AAW2DFW6_9ROSI